MIRLVAKKKLGFRAGGKIITVKPYEFATLPDEAAEDPLFKWALKDGSIEVAGAKEEAPAPIEPPKPEEPPEEPKEIKAKRRRK